MTYLVLARKWRPRSFDTLVGQEHVVRALTHALSTQRLHHAWLFTGTRGVGKTTLSRILAKALNCEAGITPTPCGVCRACTEIDAGRFVDYIELDAASNRGVDEMTQLLEQAIYSPGSGRFKVYMIDEVHMLTGHAFNAMLKTLEEPPEHVKFILATTDPQKIPVTVLSRCLQFNLKQMTAESIVDHLQMILAQEQIGFELPALRLLAKAASGSMRDALSLTDQAIAYSAGHLSNEAIQGMLGTIDQGHLVRLLRALATADALQVMQVANQLAERGFSYAGALADLAVLLSRIAVAQRIAGSLDSSDPLTADLAELAAFMHPDQVQLFYTIAVHSRHELSLAPDEYAGFVMACLRMLALVPADAQGAQTAQTMASPVQAAGDTPSLEASRASEAVSSAQRVESIHPESVVAVDAAQPPAHVLPVVQSTTLLASTDTAVTPRTPVVMTDAAAPVVQSVTEPVPGPEARPELQSSVDVSSGRHDSTGRHAADTGVRASGVSADYPAWEDHPDQSADGAPSKVSSSGQVVSDVAFEAASDTHESGPPTEVQDAPVTGHDLATDEQFGMVSDDSMMGMLDGYIPDDEGFEQLVPDFTPMALPDTREQPVVERNPRLMGVTSSSWPQLAASLPLTGLAQELARQSEFVEVGADNSLRLKVGIRTLAETAAQTRFQTVLSEYFGTVVRLHIEYGTTGEETAHAVEQAHRAALQKKAEEDAQQDPFVQDLMHAFDAHIVQGSIRAVSRSA